MKVKAIWISVLCLLAPIMASAREWVHVPFHEPAVLTTENWIVEHPPLYGTVQMTEDGLVYLPEDEFWGILNDSLVLDTPTGERTYRLYGGDITPIQATGFETPERTTWLNWSTVGTVNVSTAAAIVGNKGVMIHGLGWVKFDPTAFVAFGGSQESGGSDIGGQTATVANAMICPPASAQGTLEDPKIIEAFAKGVPQFWIRMLDGDRVFVETPGSTSVAGISLGNKAARLSMQWNTHGTLRVVLDGRNIFNGVVGDHAIDELRVGVLEQTDGWSLVLDEVFVGEIETPTGVTTALLNDDFDNLAFSAWSSAQATGVQATAASALVGGGGLEVHPGLNGETDTYLLDNSLTAETALGVRFRLDPNDVGIAAGDGIDILAGSDSDQPASGEDHLRLHLRRGNFGYLLKVVVRLDSGAVGTPWVALDGEPQIVELRWQASASPQGDGYMYLAVDGEVKQSLSGLTNQTKVIESVRLGAISADSSYSGWFIVDEYESWGPVEIQAGI